MITLALGITFYLCDARGAATGVLLLIAILADAVWLTTWASRKK